MSVRDIDVSIEAGPEDGTVNVLVVETAIGGTGLCFEVIALEKRAMFDKASSIWFVPAASLTSCTDLSV